MRLRASLNVRDSGERIELCERVVSRVRGEVGDDDREPERPGLFVLVVLAELGNVAIEKDSIWLRWDIISDTRRIASSLTD